MLRNPPTPRQTTYARHLMRQLGIRATFVTVEHLAIGATEAEVASGQTVMEWLVSMDRARIAKLIGDLKSQLPA